MVAAAGVAGAASNSMKIKGTLDTGNIDRGFSRVNQGFEKTKGQGKSFGSDMMRVAGTVGKLAKKLLFMGVAGVAALVGIASKAPAVAPAMAKMSVSFGKIQRSLGEALAPAFEKVAGLLDKLAVWVDSNKEKIGELAMKFLDWGIALGKKVWPWLEKIGKWAGEHPGLFVGILAGLALAPAVLAGIASVASLVTLMGGVTVGASLLTALGYFVLIGAAAYVSYQAITAMIEALQKYTGIDKPLMEGGGDGSGDTMLNRLPQKAWSSITGNQAPWEDELVSNSPANINALQKIKSAGLNATPGGTYSAAEDRRGWFLQWWDATWG